MTQADKHFIATCKKIIEEGYSSEGTGVRTRWEDGTEANYISISPLTWDKTHYAHLGKLNK